VCDPGSGEASLNSMAATLSAMQSSFSEWNKNVFGSVKRKIIQLKEELERLCSDSL
jgi:hypothetical protein